MIPKIIHHIWLSNEKKSFDTKYYMKSWGKFFRDYEIKCWNIDSFDINSVPFVKEAVDAKKWAFASDYIRLYALYMEGGIYLDTDMLIIKSFESLLKNCTFFSAIESFTSLSNSVDMTKYIDENYCRKKNVTKVPGIAIQAAFMASMPRHPFLRDCMEWYKNKHFVHNETYNNDIVAPDVYAQCAEKYGFIYRDIKQNLQDDIHLVPSSVIASSYRESIKSPYAIHCCNGSWRDGQSILKIKRFIKMIIAPFLFRT
jgi:mannosyltransferase OCH1-like enzyme